MSKVYRITFIALITVCCKAQTVTPLILAAGSPPYCQGHPVNFSVTAAEALNSFSWHISPARGATVNSASNTATFRATFSVPSTYTISLTASDTVARYGSIVIAVSRTATAAFNASLSSSGYPTQLVLTNYSDNYSALGWHFNDGSTDTLENVRKPITGSGARSVELIAFGQNGCNDTSRYEFYIEDSSGITLPNVFTPNNDGINDIYRPIARGMRTLNARIYNRQQILVHSWERVNGFWDGRTTSGEACPDGVYFIIVEGTGFDQKKYSEKSTITLLR